MHLSKGGFYRHRNALDVEIEIVKIQYLGPEYIKLKVNFVAIRNHNHIFESDASIKIMRKDLENWKRIV